MSDPVTMAMIGAGVGAVTNRRNPLQGALLGGALGGFGGAAMGGATATQAAAGATQAANLAAQPAMGYGAAQTAAGQTLNQGLGASLMSGAKGAFQGISSFAKESPVPTQIAMSGLQNAFQPPPPITPQGLLRGSQVAPQEQPQFAMAPPNISLI